MVNLGEIVLPRPFLVSVDGTSVSGKGTLAKGIAAHLDLRHLDSGSLYRATTFLMLKAGRRLNNTYWAIRAAREVTPDILGLSELRSQEVSRATPEIASIPEVRMIVTERQKAIARMSSKGVVIDGRATATEVIPHANVKFFVDADVGVRARRLFVDMVKKTENASFNDILLELEKRDHTDSTRSHYRLAKTEDMYEIDTTHLSIEETLEIAVQHIVSNVQNSSTTG